MRRLAENFIFRKVKRLRKTESGQSVSLEEEWREEVQLIRQDGDEHPPLEEAIHTTNGAPVKKKNSRGWTPPPTPPKPGRRPSLQPSTKGGDEEEAQNISTENLSKTNGWHPRVNPWTSFYEDGSDGTASTVRLNPSMGGASDLPNEGLYFDQKSAFEDNFREKESLPEVNVTESFAIHRYFDAEYLTHSVVSADTAMVASQMEERSEEHSRAVQKPAREKLLSTSELFETPTNSISERIANEEVAEVLKDCSSMVGVDGALLSTPLPEEPPKQVANATTETTRLEFYGFLKIICIYKLFVRNDPYI